MSVQSSDHNLTQQCFKSWYEFDKLFMITTVLTCFILCTSVANDIPPNTKPSILISESAIQLKFFNNSIGLTKLSYKSRAFSYRLSAVNLDESINVANLELKPVLISILDDTNYAFSAQKCLGHLYNGSEFVTFTTNVSRVDKIAYLVELFDATTSDHTCDFNCFARSYVLPFPNNATDGTLRLPIVDTNNSEIIGQLRVDYLIVNPIKMFKVDPFEQLIDITGVYMGHRGTGVGRRTDLPEDFQENTIAAFNYAYRHKADTIELDVQLSEDKVPVIYHDFSSKVFVKKRLDSINYEAFPVPVKDITFEQMKTISPAENDSVLRKDTDDNKPFETLKSVLENVDIGCGINIEIKYPQMKINNMMDGEKGLELNEYVDIILKTIYENIGNRTSVFITSFHPDLCSMIRLKQNKLRVAFLTSGRDPNYVPYYDTRDSTIEMATYFAQSMDLHGISAKADNLLADRSLIKFVKSRNRALYVWGSLLNSKRVIDGLRSDGCDALIFDKIDIIMNEAD